MGRTKYSADMVNTIKAAFVTAAREIIREEGIEAASIRRISDRAGYSSGTLYLYFDGIDELVTMALIASLDDYISELVSTSPESDTAEEQYRHTWKLFCRYGFEHPAEYLELFYGPMSPKLDAVALHYHELFPDELNKANGLIHEMLERGSLAERNRAVLKPLAAERGLSEKQIELANELTISYFRTFLESAIAHPFDPAEAEKQTSRFLEGAFFLIRK